MNPVNRQHSIREYEILVSGGVHEVPESVFERDTRSSGEMRVVREHNDHSTSRSRRESRIIVGTVKVNRTTGEVVD
jgi:hypothetical protein